MALNKFPLLLVYPPQGIKGGTGGGGGSGEANTASNAGVDGIGIVLPKVGVNLPFKGLNIGSSKLSITDDTTDHTVDFDVVEANLTLGNLGGTLGYNKLVLTNSILDTDIAAQTSTKITITAKGQLNSAIVYNDQD